MCASLRQSRRRIPVDHQAVLRQVRCSDVWRKRNQCHWAHLLLLQVRQRQAAQGLQQKDRSEALEIQKDELTAKIADEKLKRPSFNEDFIRFWLMKFRKFDISQKKQRKALIEIFVNAIFLYDDRMLIAFNYKDGTQTVRFEDTLTADCGEKSLRLRSNESPSGAFEQQNGLALARWRGQAPTSSDLSSLAGP